jgi:hypothetical protein
MVRLSTLLGPVRPPVASTSDVDAAGGVFCIRFRKMNETLEAEAVDGVGSFELLADAKCIICQEGYEDGEFVRQLRTCNHAYHRDCIDTVSL